MREDGEEAGKRAAAGVGWRGVGMGGLARIKSFFQETLEVIWGAFLRELRRVGGGGGWLGLGVEEGVS